MKIPSTRIVFDRKKNASRNKKGLVQIVVSYDRVRKFISTGVKLYSDQWSEKKMVINHPESVALTKKIVSIKAEIDGYIMEQREKDRQWNWTEFSQWLDRGGDTDDVTFLEFYVQRMAERNDIRESTRKQHNKLKAALVQFGQIVTFADLTNKNIMEFDGWLHRRGGLSVSGVYNYHKIMRSYINEAVRFGYITANPYTALKIDKGERDDMAGWLSDEEIERIKACVLTPSMEKVRDMAMLQYYTGVAYSDLIYINKDIVTEQDGYTLLVGERQKTGEEFVVVLMDDAKAILDRYGWNMNLMTNQQYNMRLKILADAAKIDKNITSHWFRRSAGMYYLNHGMPIEVVSRILGHASIKTTQKAYAKILNKTVTDAFGKMLEDKKKRVELISPSTTS